jgi:nucleoside-diphosphate-sugar epimerase
MLSGQTILVTGPAGNIGFPLTMALAKHNEVWGVARFSNKERRQKLDAAGVITREVDLYEADFSMLPRDFTYLVHVAVAFEQSYDRAFRSNGEGTGFLLEHCRNAKAALVMSSCSVYRPIPDPYYAYKETDPLGDPLTHYYISYPVAKISEEVVARYCARAFNLPVIVARMNAAGGAYGGLQASHTDMIAADKPVMTRHATAAYSPIFDDDIADSLEALLGAASVPATIVNWGGDEVVTVQQWCAYIGELMGKPVRVDVQPIAGGPGGMVADAALRRSITGPLKLTWQEGIRRLVAERHPGLIRASA